MQPGLDAVDAPVSAELIAAYAGGSVAQAALVAGGGVRCVPVVAAGAAPSAVRGAAAARARRRRLLAARRAATRPDARRAWRCSACRCWRCSRPRAPACSRSRSSSRWSSSTLHDNHSVAGQLAALGLIAASCTVLGALLVEVTPPRWLGVGIAATAAVDLVLVASGCSAPASLALNSAGVTESLPQLQRVELGPLTMGYADLFLPALVGALLATRGAHAPLGRAADAVLRARRRARLPRRRPAAGDGAGRARPARRRGQRRYRAAMARGGRLARSRPDAVAAAARRRRSAWPRPAAPADAAAAARRAARRTDGSARRCWCCSRAGTRPARAARSSGSWRRSTRATCASRSSPRRPRTRSATTSSRASSPRCRAGAG